MAVRRRWVAYGVERYTKQKKRFMELERLLFFFFIIIIMIMITQVLIDPNNY